MIAPCRKTFSRPGQIGMEAGGDFDQRADAAAHFAAAARRPQDARQQLEHGRLAGAVRADDAERLARLHLERHVAHRPELLRRRALRRDGRGAKHAPTSRRESDRAGCRAARRGGTSSRRRRRRSPARHLDVLRELELGAVEHVASSTQQQDATTRRPSPRKAGQLRQLAVRAARRGRRR